MAFVSKFAITVQDAMAKQGISIRDMQDASGMCYEHTRKLVKGLTHPTKTVVQAFAYKLGLNAAELERMAVEYRFKSRYGRVTSILAGVPHRLEGMVAIEPFLNDRDIEELISLANMKARINRTSVTPIRKAA